MDDTVLIVGAGFSIPYGYPSGEDLVSRIIKKWKHNSNSNEPDLNRLAIDLENVGYYSIDKFLAAKNNHLKAGITSIVHELITAERESLKEDVLTSVDVIKLVLNEVEENDFSKLKIISFNYDRLLEWKLFKKFRSLAPSDEEAIKRISKIEIIHIHGRMAPLNEAEAKHLGVDIHVPYGAGKLGSSLNPHPEVAIKFAQESLKTIYTNDDKPEPKAVIALKNAKRIFFLGFGFDEKNMVKLGINVEGIKFDWESKYIAGTRIGGLI